MMTVQPVAAFAEWFGVARQPATLLAQLYASSEPLRSTQVGIGCSPRAARVYLHRLRAAMRCEAIDTTSAGYVLLPAGRAECERAIEECAR